MTAPKLSVLIVTADSAWCDGPGLDGRGFAVQVAGNADVALLSADVALRSRPRPLRTWSWWTSRPPVWTGRHWPCR